jgi:hypothetical protein
MKFLKCGIYYPGLLDGNFAKNKNMTLSFTAEKEYKFS